MTSRRAVSPVIATVILIAVAVALGIAVAVWAGALTGGLQKQEKLIINAYVSGTPASLVLSITNQSPGSSTITQILFNQAPMTGAMTFVTTGTTGWTTVAPTALPNTLVTGGTGTVSVLATTLTVQSGITYPITIVTAAGNSYPSTITWP